MNFTELQYSEYMCFWNILVSNKLYGAVRKLSSASLSPSRICIFDVKTLFWGVSLLYLGGTDQLPFTCHANMVWGIFLYSFYHSYMQNWCLMFRMSYEYSY